MTTGAEDWSDRDHVRFYLARVDGMPHRAEGDAVLEEEVPLDALRILDLGCGDGRLSALLRIRRPDAHVTMLDVSPPMLTAARQRFGDDPRAEIRVHDLADPLPSDLVDLDAVVSGFAIHHLEDDRKRTLYAECLAALRPGGVFCNLEHVASSTPARHAEFLAALDLEPGQEDPSNRLVPADVQVGWLTDIGFADADVLWRWRELALLAAVRPG
ncbi:MAG TPA: class I SAM-dependent methyltransferase [Solirubrobacter sp.]